jgi:hypothetical protein
MQTAGSIKEMRKDGDFGTLLHEFVSIDKSQQEILVLIIL